MSERAVQHQRTVVVLHRDYGAVSSDANHGRTNLLVFFHGAPGAIPGTTNWFLHHGQPSFLLLRIHWIGVRPLQDGQNYDHLPAVHLYLLCRPNTNRSYVKLPAWHSVEIEINCTSLLAFSRVWRRSEEAPVTYILNCGFWIRNLFPG